MKRLAIFAIAAALSAAATTVGAEPAPAERLSLPEDQSATSDLGCAIRLMFISVKSKEELAETADVSEQAQFRKNLSLVDRGFAYFVGRLDTALVDPEFGRRAERIFEGLRGLSSDEMIRQANACVKVWQKAENTVVKKFQEKA